MPLPPFNPGGDLPPGIHRATLREALERLGQGSRTRAAVATRLERIDRLARSTGHLARLVVFGSFVTEKPESAAVEFWRTKRDGGLRGIVEIESEAP